MLYHGVTTRGSPLLVENTQFGNKIQIINLQIIKQPTYLQVFRRNMATFRTRISGGVRRMLANLYLACSWNWVSQLSAVSSLLLGSTFGENEGPIIILSSHT